MVRQAQSETLLKGLRLTLATKGSMCWMWSQGVDICCCLQPRTDDTNERKPLFRWKHP